MATKKTEKFGPLKCSMKEKVFVKPCGGLQQIMENIHQLSTAKGVTTVTLRNLDTFKPSRSYVVAKLGKHKKRGIIFNCCPFCGERIDGAVTESDAGKDGG